MRKEGVGAKRSDRFIPRRINILFAFVLLLFLILIGRLAQMQIVHTGFYTQKLATDSQKTITNSSVRGGIYDAKGKALVENRVKQVVTYTRANNVTAEEIKQVAKDLRAYVSMDEARVTRRQKIDYFLADSKQYAKVVDKLPDAQKVDNAGNSLSESTIYANAVASVKDKSIQYSKDEEKTIDLFSQMNAATYFETVHLATDNLTAQQIATIAANEDKLPGVSTANDWDRVVLDTSLASIIGTVTSEKAGLPEQDAESYLAKGYSMNDRVGTAYLEKQYEEVLQGKHEVKEVNLDKNGNVESIDTVQEGSKGSNIKLTVDLKFQDGVNKILKKNFQKELDSGSAAYSSGVYAVVLNPNTGAVLAMAGYSHERGSATMTENALGTVTNTFVPGSIVKGATLTAGWKYGAIQGNQVLTDQTLEFAGSSTINSWFTEYGAQNINAVQALEYSSNTYMVQVALKMMNDPYMKNMYLTADQTKIQQSMEKMRKVYGQYGLGVHTGIDLPAESIGYIPSTYNSWDYVTESFGQFDNYTPMQMAQYAATVANGGKRIAPHLVEGVYGNTSDGNLGKKIKAIKGQELNKVDISADNMSLIRQGFYQVVHGNSGYTTGRNMNHDLKMSISAKTGTAETYVTTDAGALEHAVNTNIVAYAPSDNPQIAVSVILPDLMDLESITSRDIVREIVNLYADLH